MQINFSCGALIRTSIVIIKINLNETYVNGTVSLDGEVDFSKKLIVFIVCAII